MFSPPTIATAKYAIIAPVIACLTYVCLLSDAQDVFVYEEWGGSWSDSEKSPSNPNDNLMCWAATASNVLDWTGWGYPEEASFSGTDDMFAYYVNHWTDKGSFMVYAWDWWFDGSNPSQGVTGWSQVDVPGGGFWPEMDMDDYFAYQTAGQEQYMMAGVDWLFDNGYGVGLGVYGPGGHAITAWGYSYDDVTGEYLGLYVSDSDDNKNLNSPPDSLRYYNVELIGGKWYLQSFYGSNSWYIGEVQALKAAPVALISATSLMFDFGYTESEIALLSKLYYDGKNSVDPDPVVIDEVTWRYFEDTIDGKNFGDAWYDGGTNTYYLYLGSGLEGNSSVPEPATFSGIIFALLLPWIKRKIAGHALILATSSVSPG